MNACCLFLLIFRKVRLTLLIPSVKLCYSPAFLTPLARLRLQPREIPDYVCV